MVPTQPTARSAWKWEGKDILECALRSHRKNGANKPDVIVHDKETNTWTLLEGTVCQVGKIADRVKEKQTKYIELRAGIKESTKVQAYIKSMLFLNLP